VYRLGDGRAEAIAAERAGFGYRRSDLPDDAVVVGAVMALRPDHEGAIRARMEDARTWRRETQPIAEPNCGSVFTNPPGEHAARLIDAAGGKDLRVGGARVSAKHANFIIAESGATAADVVELIEAVQALVERTSGIRLEPEVRLVGRFDRAVR
jgi:UDP-N-acetylmuramate dehydrogenase